MNVLVYNWRDIEHPDSGGAEVFTHEVLERLVDRGHEATLFTASFDGAAPETTIDGVHVVRSGGRFTVYRQAAKTYRRRFRGDFDVVVDEINTRPFMTTQFVEETPVVALIHQLAREFWFYETPFPVSHLGYYWLEDRWLKRYINVPTITVSESTRGDLAELGFEDVTVVPEGIDVDPLEEVPEKREDPSLLFVGRMTEAKRPHHAVEAFDHLKDRLPEARLDVVGDGYMLEDIRERAGPDVHVHGYVSGERKLELMRRSHLLLVPGVREGWGLVVTEANAMGTPAVGYDVHGLRDSIKDGRTGVVCSPSPEAMAASSHELLETVSRPTPERRSVTPGSTSGIGPPTQSSPSCWRWPDERRPIDGTKSNRTADLRRPVSGQFHPHCRGLHDRISELRLSGGDGPTPRARTVRCLRGTVRAVVPPVAVLAGYPTLYDAVRLPTQRQ